MTQQALLLLPALASVGYVAAVSLLKRALSNGATQAQVNLVANAVPALLFQALWLISPAVNWSHVWRPAVAAGIFLVGQVFTFRALRAGEVSIATPLLGTKVLFTAIFSAALFGQALAMRWWLGAVASALGVILVTGATWRTLAPRILQADAMYSLGAAAMFGLTDVLVGHWTHFLGVPAFIPLMFGGVGLASIAIFVPRAGSRIFVMPRIAVTPLFAGSVLLGLQVLGMAIAIGLHESATVVNVVYSSRAVWSVLLALLLARKFQMAEAAEPDGVLRRRLVGSLLVFAAVIAVLL